MELRLLKTFDTVATLQSFSRAAVMLHCSQSTVSAQIRELETRLGTPLFQRLGRSISLTTAGADLLGRARKLISEEQALYESVRLPGLVTGHIRMRVPQSVAELYLPKILATFADTYPNVGFDISTCGWFQLIDELRTGQVDAAFLYGECMSSPELHNHVLKHEVLVYVTKVGDPIAGAGHFSIADLRNRTMLLPKHDCGYRMDLERWLFAAGIQPGALYELNSVGAVAACVMAGLGIGFLPRQVVAYHIAAGHMVELPAPDPVTVPLNLILHQDRKLTGPLGHLVRTIESAFG